MKNQLLLLEDVHNVGRKGDLVKVKPGFARNFLVPKQKSTRRGQKRRENSSQAQRRES